MTPQSAAAVLQVSDFAAAIEYYKTVLGFGEDFRFGDYVGLKLGDVSVHLCGHTISQRPVGGGTVYVFCDDVDSYYAELKRKGAKLKSEPQDYPYGMRDFSVSDPDGNLISFGCATR